MARKRQASIDPISPLMTVGEAATAMHVSEETVTALVETGRWIGSHKVGRKYIIPRAAFHRLYRDGIADEPTVLATAAKPGRSPFLREVVQKAS